MINFIVLLLMGLILCVMVSHWIGEIKQLGE